MVNFNQQNSFQNALATGLQIGQAARQRDQQEQLMQQRQQQIDAQTQRIDMQRQEAAQKAQKEQASAELTSRALNGDDSALDALASLNFERFEKLDTRIKQKLAQEAETFGQAAMDVLRLPFAERQGLIMQYARNMPEHEEAINNLAFLPQNEQEAALRSAVAEAGMINKLIERENPSWRVLPEGGTLVDTNNRAAVSQFSGQPAQSSGYQEGQTATNPQTGQRIIFRNGAWGPM